MATDAMRVTALFRYPVKSMQGERIETASIGTHGIVGDRQWGLRDVDTGLVLTARREPRLLFARGRLIPAPDVHDSEIEPEVEIELPDGTIAADDDALSAWLGRRVELRRADADLAATFEDVLGIDDEDTAPWIEWTGPRGSHHDSGQVQASLIAEGSIGAWDSRRFRANIIVSGEDGDENRLVGARVRIGGSTFDVTKQIGRCIMTTRAQPATEVSGEIARDLDVLKTINAERGTYLGIGMLVDRPGSLSIGDTVEIVDVATEVPRG